MDPVRISIQGLSRWDSIFVRTTVDLASGIDLAPCRLVDDPEAADILLVDADRGQFQPPAAQREQERPIVLSFSADPTPDGHGLTRPVSYADLIAALKAAERELQRPRQKPENPAPVASRVEAVADRPAATTDSILEQRRTELTHRTDESLAEKTRPARRFVEATRYIGLLRQAVKQGFPVAISHGHYPSVLVFPDQNAFVAADDVLDAVGMFRESARAFEVRTLSAGAAATALADERCRPLGRLIYSAALYGAEGRLVLNCNPWRPLSLIDWPDFNSVPHLPEHRTIASFMLVNAADLAGIAEGTGVGVGIVIDFCNACEAVGLIRRPEPDEDQNVSDRDRLLSPMLNRMRRLFREA